MPTTTPLGVRQRRAPSIRVVTFGHLTATADFAFQAGDNGDPASEFRLDTARAGACALFRTYGGIAFAAEAIRSAGPQSLFGVAGNSLLVRVRNAFGFTEFAPGYGQLTIEAGLISDPWLRTLDAHDALTHESPRVSETAELFSPSDLGIAVAYTILDGRARLRLAVSNGEGLEQDERNRGKNIVGVLSGQLVQLHLLGGIAHLALHGGYREGTIGVGNGRNSRLFSAFTIEHPRFGLVAEHADAFGYRDRPELRARAIGVKVYAHLGVPWLGAWGRFDVVDPDLSTAADRQIDAEGGLFAELDDDGTFASSDSESSEDQNRGASGQSRLRLSIGYHQTNLERNAGPIPGLPEASEFKHIFIRISGAFFGGAAHSGDP
ncbi:MAG: hypothetical protein H6729_04645 [Deltaproteobacteria bacterium]|nr:hypothetical protein [Deltaproteobacteria bacterium]